MARGTRTEMVELGEFFSKNYFKCIIISDGFFDEFFLTRETACIFLARSLLIKNNATCDKCGLNRPWHLVKKTKNIVGLYGIVQSLVMLLNLYEQAQSLKIQN